MLIRTIKLETDDTELFSKETPLLPSATELAYHTINCSALNVEELRREDGIEVAMPFLLSFLSKKDLKGFAQFQLLPDYLDVYCKNPHGRDRDLINFFQRFAVFILQNIKHLKSNHISNKRWIKINMIHIYKIVKINRFTN